ncbi:hypothetical protein [Halogeometricum limi]|uniref:Uncharacterized protein n=1 Tax=Halogeometricum limi TaxID=555875 RepID=A0A1I6FYC4_9EURY|nr:hypothetical protein [Halogeometricum limi]SFR34837.1 hypothetical protein SAMN04488124_0524 [Halogeometricum limi]
MTLVAEAPVTTISHGTAWYREFGHDGALRYESGIELYRDYVRPCDSAVLCPP